MNIGAQLRGRCGDEAAESRGAIAARIFSAEYKSLAESAASLGCGSWSVFRQLNQCGLRIGRWEGDSHQAKVGCARAAELQGDSGVAGVELHTFGDHARDVVGRIVGQRPRGNAFGEHSLLTRVVGRSTGMEKTNAYPESQLGSSAPLGSPPPCSTTLFTAAVSMLSASALRAWASSSERGSAGEDQGHQLLRLGGHHHAILCAGAVDVFGSRLQPRRLCRGRVPASGRGRFCRNRFGLNQEKLGPPNTGRWR